MARPGRVLRQAAHGAERFAGASRAAASRGKSGPETAAKVRRRLEADHSWSVAWRVARIEKGSSRGCGQRRFDDADEAEATAMQGAPWHINWRARQGLGRL